MTRTEIIELAASFDAEVFEFKEVTQIVFTAEKLEKFAKASRSGFRWTILFAAIAIAYLALCASAGHYLTLNELIGVFK